MFPPLGEVQDSWDKGPNRLKLGLALVVLAAVLLTPVVTRPFTIGADLRAAVLARDATRLEALVDFPALRADLKRQMNVALGASPLARLSDYVVELLVAPECIIRIADRYGFAADSVGAPRPSHQVSYRLESLDRIRLEVRKAADSTPFSVALGRRGLDWKVVAMDLNLPPSLDPDRLRSLNLDLPASLRPFRLP